MKRKSKGQSKQQVTGRKYKCWGCHEKFEIYELVSHRCNECRQKRSELRQELGSVIPWKEGGAGLKKVKRVGPLGRDGGVSWKARKKVVSKPKANEFLAKAKTWKTWNDGWRPEKEKQKGAK